jgi:hypothetical protein
LVSVNVKRNKKMYRERYLTPAEWEEEHREPLRDDAAVWFRWIFPTGEKGPWKPRTYHEAKIDRRVSDNNEYVVIGSPPEDYHG